MKLEVLVILGSYVARAEVVSVEPAVKIDRLLKHRKL
jgi:hypothetical protein